MTIGGASILVTGGTGSFGQAFVDYAIKQDPKRLVVFSRGEHLQEQMAQKLDHPSLRFFIGDVRDQSRLELAMRGIDYVIHAAALKIIPTAEYNPTESVATNVLGAQNVMNAAIKAGVKKVVALSTDKAASPCTLYGATKLAAEKVFTSANHMAGGDCLFSCVRYGNIAGSRGSVIPLFKDRAKAGLPLPITHHKMTRFYFTLKEAVALVLYAFETMKGGEVFIPQMPSFKIMDLAEAIDPGGTREFVGIRGAEKLHEDIITSHESRMVVRRDDYYVLMPPWIAVPDHEAFSIASDDNKNWLSVQKLRSLIWTPTTP